MKALLSKPVAFAACAMVALLASCESTSSAESDSKALTDSVPATLPPNMIAWAGQNYRTVVIGKQTWMAENLNYKGTGTDTVGVCYNNSADSCKKYGRLYTWMAAMGLADSCKSTDCKSQIAVKHQGICPTGWHVPTEWEWQALEEEIGDSIAGKVLKSKSGWNDSGNGMDTYGFSVLPAGWIHPSNNNFVQAGSQGVFWATTPQNMSTARFRFFRSDTNRAISTYNNIYRTSAFSIRCLKD